MPASCQSLQQILAAFTVSDATYSASINADWLQGRTVFGGLVAALADQAMRDLLPEPRALRALQIAYIGPNAEGRIDFKPNILRHGKAVTLATCNAYSAGQLTMTATAMYGAARSSQLALRPSSASIATRPEQLADVARHDNLPSFTRHYQQRWARGAPLFSRADDSRMSVYVRYRDEPVARLQPAHALALMDAIPSPALALLGTPSPASTLSWTLEIVDPQFDFAVDEWWRLDAEVDAAVDGYVTHTSHVVNPAGHVAAISRQVVVVYA